MVTGPRGGPKRLLAALRQIEDVAKKTPVGIAVAGRAPISTKPPSAAGTPGAGRPVRSTERYRTRAARTESRLIEATKLVLVAWLAANWMGVRACCGL